MIHSQGNEQPIILNYFGTRIGTFIDIGAADGKTFSNTYALGLLGWSGVCVDASPGAYPNLVETYKNSAKVQCIHAAITTKRGNVTFHECSDSLVSSLNAEHKAQWDHHGFTWTEVEVMGITFKDLVDIAGIQRAEFINIDAEGHDLEILRQIDLKTIGCEMLCIEHGGWQGDIKAYCEGFRVIHDGDINMILAR